MNAGLFTRRLLSHKPTVRNVAVRNASNIKQCRSSKNYNDNNNNNAIKQTKVPVPVVLYLVPTGTYDRSLCTFTVYGTCTGRYVMCLDVCVCCYNSTFTYKSIPGYIIILHFVQKKIHINLSRDYCTSTGVVRMSVE